MRESGEVGSIVDDCDELLPEFARPALEGLRPKLAALLFDRSGLLVWAFGGGCFVRRLAE